MVLLPTVHAWLVAIALVAVVGLAAAVAGVALLVFELAPVIARHHRVRRAREQSLPAYYGHLVLGH